MQAVLSHYRILEQIGAGGMGVVYRAHDERLDRDVALKVLPPGTLSDEAARKRFRKEALALSKVNHPNIAVVHDFDTEDSTDFLVEELIPGLSLSDMLSSGPLRDREIINLGSQLADGLAAAHEQGVLHCDLKPANVRVTPDARLKILDFGLAKMMHRAELVEPTASLTETQVVSGTVPYMAPEQLLNEKLDGRTDIWAAGCVLYEMATGRRPFLGSGPALTDAILHQKPTAPSKLNSRVSPGLEAIILKCLDKDRSLRYASARDLAVDLHRLISGAPATRMVPQPRRARARNLVIAATGVVLLVLAGFVVLRLKQPRPQDQVARSIQETPSIAVLPFVNMSSDREQEYFSDGLAEELLNNLAKIQGLRVVGRTSSFQFKGKNEDLRTVGEKLNVSTILEGSVRKEGKRIRITAQLIKANDGFHLWSESYDRELNDIFAVQEDIARSVAASLKVTLLGANTATPATQGRDVEAYNAVLQGQYFQQRRGKQDLEKAITFYEQAIRIDPNYAAAWAGLARAYLFQAYFGYTPRDEGYRSARQAAERALALEPNLVPAHEALCRIRRNYDWDWTGADASCQRALAIEPGGTMPLRGSALLAAALGRFEEALALARRAVELDPLSVNTHHVLGAVAYSANRLDEATMAFKRVLEFIPDRPGAHTGLGDVYLAQAHFKEALAEMQREPQEDFRLSGLARAYHALGQRPESEASLSEMVTKYHASGAYKIAEVYAYRGEADQAFEWLERAYIQRDPELSDMKADPLLKNIKGDPRYVVFLKKMRLPLN